MQTSRQFGLKVKRLIDIQEILTWMHKEFTQICHILTLFLKTINPVLVEANNTLIQSDISYFIFQLS